MATQLNLPIADRIEQWLRPFRDIAQKRTLERLLKPTISGSVSQALTTAGLVIAAGGSTLAKIGASDFYAIVDGALVKIAAATNMPALTGFGISQSAYNVVLFVVDQGGTVSALLGIEGADIAHVVFPTIPEGKALVGFLLITYGAGAFVGGTTALDTATTLYFSPTGAVNPGLVNSLG